jgi:PST family polysaccharide transporter
VSESYFKTERSRKGLKGLAIRGAAAKVVSQAGCAALQLASGVVLARLLVPDDFGLVAMVVAYTMILSDVGELGLAQALVQADEVTHEKVSWLFWINVALSTAMALLFVSFSPLVAWFYGEPRLEPIAMVLASGFVLRGLGAQHLGLLNRSMRFTRVAILDLTAVAVSVVAAITMAWWGWGLWSLVARRLIAMFITAAGAWLLSGWRPGFHVLVPGSGPLIRYGVHTFGAQALMNVRQNVDKVLLGWQYGAVPLGLYDRAQQLFVLPFNQITSPMAAVAVATLSRLRTERARYLRYYFEAVEVVAFIGMGLSVVLTVGAHEIVGLLLGPQWLESGAIFMAFGPGIGMLLLSSAQNWLHLSLGRADRSFRWNLVVLATSVVMLAIGSLFGPVGAALAYSTSLFLLFGPGFRYAGAPIGLRPSLVVATVWRYFAAAVAAGAVCWSLLHRVAAVSSVYSQLDVLSKVIVVVLVCVAVYLLCTLLLHGSAAPISRLLALVRELAPRSRQGAASTDPTAAATLSPD